MGEEESGRGEVSWREERQKRVGEKKKLQQGKTEVKVHIYQKRGEAVRSGEKGERERKIKKERE